MLIYSAFICTAVYHAFGSSIKVLLKVDSSLQPSNGILATKLDQWYGYCSLACMGAKSLFMYMYL